MVVHTLTAPPDGDMQRETEAVWVSTKEESLLWADLWQITMPLDCKLLHHLTANYLPIDVSSVRRPSPLFSCPPRRYLCTAGRVSRGNRRCCNKDLAWFMMSLLMYLLALVSFLIYKIKLTRKINSVTLSCLITSAWSRATHEFLVGLRASTLTLPIVSPHPPQAPYNAPVQTTVWFNALWHHH